MNQLPPEAFELLLECVSKTGGNAEIAQALVQFTGDAPVLEGVRRGQATLGDVSLLRTLAQRCSGKEALDLTRLLLAELVGDMETMAEANGASLATSSAYRAATGLLSGDLTPAAAVRELRTLRGLPWRVDQGAGSRLHLSLSGGPAGWQSAAAQPALGG